MKKILFVHIKNDFTGSTRVLSSIIEQEYKDQQVKVITCFYNKEGFFNKNGNVKIISPIHLRLNNSWILNKLSSFIRYISFIFLLIYYIPQYSNIYIMTIFPYQASIIAFIFRKKITYHINEKFVIKNFNIKLC